MYSLALVDGILHNSALHNMNSEKDSANYWNSLAKNLDLYPKSNYSTHQLRQRWVFGASTKMAGKQGSLTNLKDVFAYTDS